MWRRDAATGGTGCDASASGRLGRVVEQRVPLPASDTVPDGELQLWRRWVLGSEVVLALAPGHRFSHPVTVACTTPFDNPAGTSKTIGNT